MNPYSHIFGLNTRKEFKEQIDKELSNLVHPTLSRPEHVLSVFYLGDYLIKKVFGFRNFQLNTGACISFRDIWKYIAIFHDIGYGPQYQKESRFADYNPNVVSLGYYAEVYDSVDKNNKKWLKSFNKDELLFYYSYWQEYGLHECIENGYSDGYELYEHGILGGYLFSKRYHNKKPKSFKGSLDDWNDIVLITTIVMSQHNIWPISDTYLEKWDFGELYNGQNGKMLIRRDGFTGNHINFSHRMELLSFAICLIDSIDIVKRFYGKRRKNGYEYISSLGLLKKAIKLIDFEVERKENEASIIIKATQLKESPVSRIRKVYEKWVRGILNMGSFLDVKVREENGSIAITISNLPSKSKKATDQTA